MTTTSTISTDNSLPGPGDRVWTYVKRGSETPILKEGVVQAVLDMPSVMPQAQYVLMIDGVLVVRDKYTCSKSLEMLPVFDKVGETDLYHD